jgi:hypothetical protein
MWICVAQMHAQILRDNKNNIGAFINGAMEY